MVRISKLTDYATIILRLLAKDLNRIASATTIAHESHLRVPTVSKILKILSEAGLVSSFRGIDGGYQITRSAHEITIADIVTAVEGQLAVTECCATHDCSLDSWCGAKENWQKINKIILDALAGVKLSDMIRPPMDNSLRGIPVKLESRYDQ